MSGLFDTRKTAIFYLYAKTVNEDNTLEYFTANTKNIDMEYLNKLISVYDPSKAKDIIAGVLEKEELTLLHIVILCLLKSENLIRTFTKDDVSDYFKISSRYTDQFLVDIITALLKTKSLNLAS